LDSEKIGMLADALSRGKISRRDFLRTAVGVGLSMPAAMGLLQACAPTPAPTAEPTKKILKVGMELVPANCDPFAMAQWGDLPILTSVMDSLFDYDYDKAELIPVLVEEWEQKDPLTWYFKLKEGVQFHKDWGEMTAEDYAWWVNESVTQKGENLFAFGDGIVTEAAVTGKYEMEITLNQPWAAFWVTTLIDYGGIVFSKKAYEEMGAQAFALNPIGTGPFEVESWTPGGEVVLKRFEDYHDPNLPHMEEIRLVGVEDTLVRLEKMRAGELDFTYNLDFKDVADMEADPNLNVMWGPGLNYDNMGFNTKEADKPWGNKLVRQAIAYAVDRQQIVDTLYYGGATPDDDILPKGYLGAEPDQQFYPDTANVEKAKELLAEAGYPDGFAMPVMVDNRDLQVQEAQLLADQLSKVGIMIELEVVDKAAFSSRTSNVEFHTLVTTSDPVSPDSDSAAAYYRTGDLWSLGYSNPTLDDLKDQAAASLDTEERARLYREIVDIVAEDCPRVILCNIGRMFVLNAGLAGFIPGPLELFPRFKNLYWTE